MFWLCLFAVYLYGAASSTDYRKTVPQIRAGEYEGLQEKVTDDSLDYIIIIIYYIYF